MSNLNLSFEEILSTTKAVRQRHELTQIALIPLAYTAGTDFKKPPRHNIGKAIHWIDGSPKGDMT